MHKRIFPNIVKLSTIPVKKVDEMIKNTELINKLLLISLNSVLYFIVSDFITVVQIMSRGKDIKLFFFFEKNRKKNQAFNIKIYSTKIFSTWRMILPVVVNPSITTEYVVGKSEV